MAFSRAQQPQIKYLSQGLPVKEILLSGGIGALALGALSLILFKSRMVLIVGMVLGAFLGPWWWKRQRGVKQRTALRQEFKDALYGLMVSLRAGRSLEGAFLASLEDMDPKVTPILYPEWKKIVGEIRVGFPVEECLRGLGERCELEEILSFARAVEICKRSEGDIATILEGTIRSLQDRMEIKAEIEVMIAQKRLEQRIMSIAPLAVLMLLMVLSPDYLAPLYESLLGRLIMILCIFFSVFSVWIARKIVTIEW